MNKKLSTKQSLLIMIIIFIFSASLFSIPAQTKGKIFPFYQESFHFKVKAKILGITGEVGNIAMKTKIMKKKKLLRTIATIKPFKALKSFYYVNGVIGAEWNYETRKSHRAFETVYQGKKYQKRYYLFKGKKVLVKKHEKTFTEYSHPHSGKILSNNKSRKWVYAPGYHDLIGSFYWLRSAGYKMKVGKVVKLKVLPAGSKKYIIIKILRKKKIKVPALGTRWVYHVRSGLINSDKVKKASGGSKLFFQTKSPIDMYITADEHAIPVKMWTKVPYIGTVQIVLYKYSQP